MVDILFFRGRVGRLRYFLLSLASGLALGLLAFVLILLFIPHYHRGETPSIGAFVVPLMIFLPLAIWFLFSLQAARFRDIGWKPLYVVPGWLLFTVIDAYVAYKIPDWAVGRQYHTVVGIVVNTAITIILMFMPGRSGDDTPSYIPEHRLLGGRTAAQAPTRSVNTYARPAPGAKVGFGRRGL